MAGAPDLVRAERVGATLVLVIDHPPVNVLSRSVLEALIARLDGAEADEAVRVVVLTSAAERAFAAGANIRDMASMGSAEARIHGGLGQAVTRRIERLPLPVIAAVHGVCFGGGCEIALACDFIVASDDAQFGQPEINLGILPGWGGTRRLPRRIGPARARRWIYLGGPVSAAEAYAVGLVDRVVPRAELRSAALSLAGELTTKSALALAAVKYAVLNAVDPDIDRGLAYELDVWSRMFGTDSQREGMRAFVEKRAPGAVSRVDWARQSAGFPWAAVSPAAATGGKRKKPKVSRRH